MQLNFMENGRQLQAAVDVVGLGCYPTTKEVGITTS
jgi:hypothetical protein